MKVYTAIKSLMAGVALVSLPIMAQEVVDPVKNNLTTEVESEIEKTGYWGDIVYGSPDAKIEIVEYASLTCSHCGHFASEIFPKLKEKYIDTGKVRLRFRNFMLNQFDFAITIVTRCKDEELAKKLTHTFLSKQSEWLGQENPVVVLEGLAAMDGLPLGEFDKCIENKDLAAHIGAKRGEWANNEKIEHTPTIKLDGIELAPPTWIKIDTALEMKLATLK